jgi:hypothetical protein
VHALVHLLWALINLGLVAIFPRSYDRGEIGNMNLVYYVHPDQNLWYTFKGVFISKGLLTASIKEENVL